MSPHNPCCHLGSWYCPTEPWCHPQTHGCSWGVPCEHSPTEGCWEKGGSAGWAGWIPSVLAQLPGDLGRRGAGCQQGCGSPQKNPREAPSPKHGAQHRIHGEILASASLQAPISSKHIPWAGLSAAASAREFPGSASTAGESTWNCPSWEAPSLPALGSEPRCLGA